MGDGMRTLETHSPTAKDLVGGLREWSELLESVRAVNRDMIVGRQTSSESRPKGGQTALRSVLSSRLEDRGWSTRNLGIFRRDLQLPSFFKLDFRKGPLGVVMSTQNAGYLVRNLTNLQLAAGPESSQMRTSVELGVLLIPTERHKAWSRMDSSVATYEDAKNALQGLSTLLTAPISILGLDAAEGDGNGVPWEATGLDVFPGGG